MKSIFRNSITYVRWAALVVALFFCALPLHAQVNTEKLRAWDDSVGLSGALAFNLSLKSGNTNFLEYGFTGRSDLVGSWYRFFLLADFHLLRKDGEDFSRRAFFHARLNVPVNNWLTWELFGQEENNRSTRLKQRWLTGTGVRAEIVRTETFLSYLGTAAMYEYEELSEWTAGMDEPIVSIFRWSNYLVLRLKLAENIEVQNTLYYQPRFDSFGDYRILEEAALVVKLWESVSLRNELHFRYDSRPPADVEAFDLALNLGFSVAL